MSEIADYLGRVHGHTLGRMQLSWTRNPDFPETMTGRMRNVVDDDQTWHPRTDAELADAAAAVAEYPVNAYLRMSTVDPDAPIGHNGRGTVEQTCSVGCMWLDVDTAHATAHATTDPLPPHDLDVPYAAMTTAGLLVPTLIVDSGHGWYPLWILDPPAVVLDPAKRAEFQQVAAAVDAAMATGMRAIGYHHDMGTVDLARVLRIPGTINAKPGCPTVPVRVIEEADTGVLYTLADIAESVAQYMKPESGSPQRAQGGAPTQPPSDLGVRAATAGSGAFAAASGAMNVAQRLADDIQAGRTSWGDILTPHGWTFVRRERNSGADLWKRPGDSASEYSAKTWSGTNGLGMVVWSTAAGLKTGSDQRLSPFRVFAELNYCGDSTSAAQALIAGLHPEILKGAGQ